MLHHRIEADLDSQATGAHHPISAGPTVAALCVENEGFEDLLDAICAPLVGRTSFAKRSELRAEMRQHLQALAQAYYELGETPERSVSLAIAKFGNPKQVAREWNLSALTRGSRWDVRDWFAANWRGAGAVAALCGLAGLMGFALHGTTGSVSRISQSSQIASAGSVRTGQGSSIQTRANLPFSHRSMQYITCVACHAQNVSLGMFQSEFRSNPPLPHSRSQP